ncbi:MAG TPA: DUF480 domain-containing protein [Dermatophilaceae bacterium]|nr:DUF480 domain-containing protein [Dermatophilaceae bacterium]
MTQVHPSPGLPVLGAVDQRVLGSLMEKQRTVPASYPLTLNALRAACNQTSSREPVVDYDEATVETCARDLKHRELLRIVVAPKGVRTLKYHERLTERLELAEDQAALVTVLLLRGPQTPQELKTRTERLHTFAGRDEVEACLQRMASREPPLVHELPRKAGHHDNRWIHPLGPVADDATAPTSEPGVDRETVLSAGDRIRNAHVIAGYDAVAQAYADRFADELDHKPFDTWLLGRIAALAGGEPVADVGCGPGHTTGYLAASGAEVTGFDVSPGMIAQAQERHPEVAFEVGDLRRMLRPRTGSGWGALTAWYALVHLAPSELPDTMSALARVLRPGGWLAVAFHVGSRVEHLDSWFEQDVDLDFVLQDPLTVRKACETAGLVVHEWYIRSMLPGIEAETERLYVLARKP